MEVYFYGPVLTKRPVTIKGDSMRYIAPIFLFLASAAGCAPATLGAHAIHPALNADSKEAWIYLQSEDKALTGIYRCYDSQQNPVCQKAKLQNR